MSIKEFKKLVNMEVQGFKRELDILDGYEEQSEKIDQLLEDFNFNKDLSLYKHAINIFKYIQGEFIDQFYGDIYDDIYSYDFLVDFDNLIQEYKPIAI